MPVNKELVIVVVVALLLIAIGAVLAGFGTSPLQAPTLTAEVDGGKVILSWEGEGDRYELYRSTEPGVKGEMIANLTATAYVDEPGPGTFYYKVKAFKGSQESPFSNEVEVTIALAKPVVEEVRPSFQGCLKDEEATFEVVGENIESCAYSFDGESWSEWLTPPLTVAIPDGVSELYVKCKNGNVEGDIYKVEFTVDRQPPTVALINPYVEGGYLKGIIEASEPVSCVALLENGSSLAEFEVEGRREIEVPLPFGKYLITFQCSDACGNVALLYYEADNTASQVGENETGEKGYVMELSINDGDSYTYSRAVILNIKTENVTHCRFANEVDYPEVWSSWVEAENGEWEKSWLLSEDYGWKKVYMQCKDGETVVGEVYDRILYKDRDSGGGGGEVSNPIAGVEVYGMAQQPALVEGMNPLPVGEEPIPIVEVPGGREGMTNSRYVYAHFTGAGDKARYILYLGSAPVWESEWDPAYVNGVMLLSLPVLGAEGLPQVYTYTLKQEVVKGSAVASAETTFVYDKAPPEIKDAEVDVSAPENFLYYVYSLKFSASDEGTGIDAYVLDVQLYNDKGQPIYRMAYYKKVDEGDVKDRVLVMPGGATYRATLYVFDKVGNFDVKEMRGVVPPTDEEALPTINSVKVYDLSWPSTEESLPLFDRPVVEVSAENVVECSACLVPALSTSTGSSCGYFRDVGDGLYKLDFEAFPDSYEGPAYVVVTCRDALGREASTSEIVSVDLAPPRIYFGDPVVIPPIPPFTDDYSIAIPVVYEDANLAYVSLCDIVGEDGSWSALPPSDSDVRVISERCRESNVTDGSTRVEAVGGAPISPDTQYVKVRASAGDALGRETTVEYPEWVYPAPSSEGGLTAE